VADNVSVSYVLVKTEMSSLNFKVPTELLSVTVLGRGFQVDGAEQQNACFATIWPVVISFNTCLTLHSSKKTSNKTLKHYFSSKPLLTDFRSLFSFSVSFLDFCLGFISKLVNHITLCKRLFFLVIDWFGHCQLSLTADIVIVDIAEALQH